MSQEIIYTSAPQGLRPGSFGFCIVAMTTGMPTPLAERLESLSGYRHVYSPGDPRAVNNPVVHSHVQLKIGAQKYFVLSRLADAGFDYSQRTNKLVHHVALEPSELVAGGPAWVLSQPGYMVTSFSGYSLQSPAPQNVTSAVTWYYAYQGREQGPIDFNTLASMFSSRQLAPETEVWSQGMINWTPAQNVPGLVPPQAPAKSSMGVSSYSTESVRSETEQVSAATIRALTDSRPWVAFIAIIGFLYALLTLLSGVFQLIVGARSGVFPVTASGLTTIVMSLVIAFGAWLLVSFGSAISNVERSRREASLVRALSTLKSFWVYIGVVLIVILTFVILGVILVISVAGTIAGSFPELD